MKTARFTPGDVLKPFSRKQVLTKAELLLASGHRDQAREALEPILNGLPGANRGQAKRLLERQ